FSMGPRAPPCSAPPRRSAAPGEEPYLLRWAHSASAAGRPAGSQPHPTSSSSRPAPSPWAPPWAGSWVAANDPEKSTWEGRPGRGGRGGPGAAGEISLGGGKERLGRGWRRIWDMDRRGRVGWGRRAAVVVTTCVLAAS